MNEPSVQLKGFKHGRDVFELNLDGHNSACWPAHPDPAIQSLGVSRGTLHFCNACRSMWFVEGEILSTPAAVAIVRDVGQSPEFVWWTGADHVEMDGDFGARDLERLALALRSGPPPEGGYKAEDGDR